MEAALSNTHKYFIPAITDDEDNILAAHLFNLRDVGPTMWLFTSHERAKAFMSEFMSRPVDETEPYEENKAFIDVLEQRRGEIGNKGLNFGKHFLIMTVTQMLPVFEKNDVARVIVDPGFPGEEERTYKPPHKV